MNKKPKTSMLRVIYKTFACMCKAAPATLSIYLVTSLLFSFIQFIEIIGMQKLFDRVTDFASGNATLNDALLMVVIIGIILVSSPLIESVLNIFQGHLYRKTGCYLQSLMHKKTSKIRLINFELSDTFEFIKKASDGSNEAPSACRGVLNLCTYYIPFWVLTMLYLISVKPVLLLAIALIFIPVLISEFLRASEFYKLRENTVNLQRKTDYYRGCISSREYFKETRTKNAFTFFNGLYINNMKLLIKESWKTTKKVVKIDLALGVINIIGYSSILFLLVFYLWQGDITVGMFAAVYYSISKLYGISQQLVSEFGSIMRDVALGSYLFDFLSEKENIGEHKRFDELEDIILQNVSFHYPGNMDVLKNINLDIKAGETIAIVGENGAGKTTLTKIIMGLYEPTAGKVYVGNNDISKFSIDTSSKSISAVFQQFQKYQMQLDENIRISDIDSENSIDRIINDSGIDLNERDYPDGIHTMLSREFDGVDLSGGQWQRVAIARGLYREHSLIILDEPTSAIDPIEETRIYNKFMEVTKNKTAVLVTHRIGSARIADRIIVMENGEIIEMGSHEALIDKHGLYYKLLKLQSSWYER